MHGYWRGQAEARLTNAAEMGLAQAEIPVTTNNFRWSNELSIDATQPETDMNPWVTFILPGDATLAGRSATVRLRLHTEFPQMVGDSSFVTGERDMAADVSLVLAAPGAGWTYQCLWYGALACSGLLLTLAARLLHGSSRPQRQMTQTAVIPCEGR